MANVTKADFIAQVAAQAGTDKTTAANVIKAFEETVQATIKKGDTIVLTGFLKFEQGRRGPGKVRNPRTGEMVTTKAKRYPKVSPGQSLKKVINGESPAPGLTAAQDHVHSDAPWAAEIERHRRNLDLKTRFAQEGRRYAELDDDGRVVVRDPARQARPASV